MDIQQITAVKGHPNRKYYIIGGGILLAGGIVYLALDTAHQKKIIATIVDKLQSGEGAYGSLKDIQEDPAFNKDYWKTSGSNNLLANQSVISYATKIYNSIGNLYDDETAIVNIYRNQLRNKAQASQVADYFQKKYSRDLSDFISEHVDKGTNPQDIQDAVQKMPLK